MRTLIIMLVAIAATGCTVGPDYKRPIVTVPDAYRDSVDANPAAADAVPIGDQAWWDVFQDDQLRDLIRIALRQNLDLRIAATRILEAQAQLGITRADQFPTIDGAASTSRTRAAKSVVPFPLDPYQVSDFQLTATAAWEIDFWGKFRRATEAARASLLASEWGRRAVATSLVSQVASAYFEMRAFDLQLDIATRTLTSRRESLRLTEVSASGGATSLIDVRQAEQLVFNAEATIADLERQIAQEENFISVLLGRNPSDVLRGASLEQQMHLPDVPTGLPSTLLERRPDIRQAEQVLIAANANIGVAKAAYFPQISLTGSGGAQSQALSDLFTTPAGIWSIGAGLTQPIFNAGRIRSRVALSKAQQEEAVLAYQQAIQQSLREVSDALVGYRKGRVFRERQQLLNRAATDARRLADIRYRGGAASYLEVLDSDTRMFTAELGVAQAELSELLSLVQVYRALGGGWQQ
ncbi:MAG TPA: efflux transporter outer membrane subunit [Vicinamibacterales bacterium]|nr:efflux transporter outer membrane subunit [Vicinamibacterales bacterium]